MLADAVHRGRRIIALITYHYSKGSRERGCAGFNYDREAAVAHTFQIKQQVEFTFGAGHQTVYPIVCGFETDEEALILHGVGGGMLNLAEIREHEEAALPSRLRVLFPDMPEQVLLDLMPLICGNIQHITEVCRADRELDIEHHEWVICVGRGFDSQYTAEVIQKTYPDLHARMHLRTAVLNWRTRALQLLDS